MFVVEEPFIYECEIDYMDLDPTEVAASPLKCIIYCAVLADDLLR